MCSARAVTTAYHFIVHAFTREVQKIISNETSERTAATDIREKKESEMDEICPVTNISIIINEPRNVHSL